MRGWYTYDRIRSVVGSVIWRFISASKATLFSCQILIKKVSILFGGILPSGMPILAAGHDIRGAKRATAMWKVAMR